MIVPLDARWLGLAEQDTALGEREWCGARLATRAEVKRVGYHPLLAGVVWCIRICGKIHRMVMVAPEQELSLTRLVEQEKTLGDQLGYFSEQMVGRRSVAYFAVLQHQLPEAYGALRRYICPLTCRRADCAGKFDGPFTEGLPVASTIASWVDSLKELDAHES